LKNAVKICIRHEISLLNDHQSSELTDWLRSLCQFCRDDSGSEGVGVVGMCLTGGFVIPMMIDPSVTAAVAAQPSLPFKRSPIGVETAKLEQSVKNKENVLLMVLRYENDWMSPLSRQQQLANAFCGDKKATSCLGFTSLTLPGKGHSTLTSTEKQHLEHRNQARKAVVEFFKLNDLKGHSKS